MSSTITFEGPSGPSILSFEVEQDPDGTNFWGVWEKLDTEPESDEIVALFTSEEEALAWIQRQLLDPETYLRSRGLVL